MTKYKKRLGGLLLFPLILIVISSGALLAQSSTNYKIKKSVIDNAGAVSQSTNHRVVDAVGQSYDNGEMTSTNYRFSSGFLAGGAVISSTALSLAQGWNMFSINVEPTDPDVETVMSSIVDKLVLVKSNSGNTYIPAYGINTIGDINFKEGYQAYLKETVPLAVFGQSVAANTPIDIPAGWGMISYLPKLPIDAAAALTSISSQLVIAKNNAGQSYIPAYGINQIGQMQVGQGYQVYLSAAGTLTYPSGGLLNSASNVQPASEVHKIKQPGHFQFTDYTGENAIVIVTTDIEPKYSDGSLLEAGDEIGVFTGAGLCCGAIAWEGINTAITVWGDDSQTDSLDGFKTGEIFCFLAWKSNDNIEYPANITFQESHPHAYQINGLSVLTDFVADLTMDMDLPDAAAIPTNFELLRNYPNPFNPKTTIQYSLPQPAEVVLTIYDLRGQTVRQLVHATKSAGYHSTMWDGRDQAGRIAASGMYFYRVEIKPEAAGKQSFVNVKKMILMK